MRFQCSKIGSLITGIVQLFFLMDFAKCSFSSFQQQATAAAALAVMNLAEVTATTTAAAISPKDNVSPASKAYLRLYGPNRSSVSNTKKTSRKSMDMWPPATYATPSSSSYSKISTTLLSSPSKTPSAPSPLLSPTPSSLPSMMTFNSFVSFLAVSLKYEALPTTLSTYRNAQSTVTSTLSAAPTATLISVDNFSPAGSDAALSKPLSSYRNRDGNANALSDDDASIFYDFNEISMNATNDYEDSMNIIRAVDDNTIRTSTVTTTSTTKAATTAKQKNCNPMIPSRFLNDFLLLNLSNTIASSLVLSENGNDSNQNNNNNKDNNSTVNDNKGARSNNSSSSFGNASSRSHGGIYSNNNLRYYKNSTKNSSNQPTLKIFHQQMNSQKSALNSTATTTAGETALEATAATESSEAATVFSSLRITNDKINNSRDKVENKLIPLKLEKTDAPMLNYIFDTFSSAKKHHHHDQRHGPHFEDMQRVGQTTNITVQAGEAVLLNCRISLLQDKTVSWVRRNPQGEDGLDLLTVGPHTYTGDKRYTMQFQYPSNWRLKISNVRKADEAMYECQISTHPPRVIQTNLLVNAPKVMIVDEFGDPLQEKYYEIDSTLQLTCIVRNVAMTSAVVFWKYGAEQVLNYDITRGGVSVKTDLMEDGANSTLFIAKINKSDSGNYTCLISGTQGSSITVHILNGESFAELHHGLAAANGTPYVTLILTLVLIIFMRIHVGKS